MWAPSQLSFGLFRLDARCIGVGAEEREEARRNVAAMRRVQGMYMPEPRADALVDEKQKVCHGLVSCVFIVTLFCNNQKPTGPSIFFGGGGGASVGARCRVTLGFRANPLRSSLFSLELLLPRC